MKELKAKIDSIRRTLKNQNITVTSQEIENKLLELCPNFPDDWCSDVRTEIIKSLAADKQPSAMATPAAGIAQTGSELTEDEETSICVDGETGNIEPITTGESETFSQVDSELTECSLTISSADKQALVATQSSALGITLTEDETTAIADTIDDVFDDYSSFISSVTSAIKGYIAHKFDTLESDLEADTVDVRNYLTDRTNQLNQKVANYAQNVKAIKGDTEVIRRNLKTSEDAVLSRFRVGIFTAK